MNGLHDPYFLDRIPPHTYGPGSSETGMGYELFTYGISQIVDTWDFAGGRYRWPPGPGDRLVRRIVVMRDGSERIYRDDR